VARAAGAEQTQQERSHAGIFNAAFAGLPGYARGVRWLLPLVCLHVACDDAASDDVLVFDAGLADAAAPLACEEDCVERGICLPPLRDDCGEGSFARVDGTCAESWPCPEGWSRASDGYGCVGPDALRDDCPEGSFAVPGGDCTEPWICPDGWSRAERGGCEPPPDREDCPEHSVPLPWGRCSEPWICLEGWRHREDGPGCLPAEPDCPDGAPATPSGLCLTGDVFEDCGDDVWGPRPWPEGTVYVDAAAVGGGDGTRERPLATLEAAVDAVPRGGTIALAAGEYVARSPPAGVTVGGRCAARTRLVGRLALRSGRAHIRDLALQDVAVTNTATFTRVDIRPTVGFGVGARTSGSDLRVSGALTLIDGTRFDCARCAFDGGLEPGLGAQRGAALTLSQSVVRGTDDRRGALTLLGGTASLEDVAIESADHGLWVQGTSALDATGLALHSGSFGLIAFAETTVDLHHVAATCATPGQCDAFQVQGAARLDGRWVDASGYNAVVSGFEPGCVVTLRDAVARDSGLLAHAREGARIELIDAVHLGPATVSLVAEHDGSMVTGAGLVTRVGDGLSVFAQESGQVVVTDADLRSSDAVVSLESESTLEMARVVFEGRLVAHDSTATLSDVVAHLPGAAQAGAVGGALTMRRVVVTGDADALDTAAIIVSDGTRGHLEDVDLRYEGSAGIVATGAELTLRRARVRAGSEGELEGRARISAAVVISDAEATIDASRFEDGAGPILTALTGSELEMTRVFGAGQEGVILSEARATLDALRLEDVQTAGVWAQESELVIDRAVVRGVRPERRVLGGIVVTGSTVSLTDIEISDTEVVGLGVVGAVEGTLSRVTIRDIRRAGLTSQADAVFVVGSAHLALDSLSLLRSQRGGLALAGPGTADLGAPSVTARNVSVVGPTRDDASVGAASVIATFGSRLELSGARIVDGVTVGLGARHGAQIQLRAVEARSLRPRRGSVFEVAFGLYSDSGARIHATDLRVVDAADVGVWVGPNSSFEGIRVEVSDTRAWDLPGNGLRVSGGHLQLDGFASVDNDEAGVAVAPGVADLRCGRIAGNRVGVRRAQANTVLLDEVDIEGNADGPDSCDPSCVDRAPDPPELD